MESRRKRVYQTNEDQSPHSQKSLPSLSVKRHSMEEKLGRTPILAWGEKATLEGWPAGSLNRNPVTPDLQEIDPADLQNRWKGKGRSVLTIIRKRTRDLKSHMRFVLWVWAVYSHKQSQRRLARTRPLSKKATRLGVALTAVNLLACICFTYALYRVSNLAAAVYGIASETTTGVVGGSFMGRISARGNILWLFLLLLLEVILGVVLSIVLK